MEYTPNDQEREVIRITKDEKTEWGSGTVWVTDKIRYQMLGGSGIIYKSRKNYLGKFDSEYDEVTGKKKTFPPMTEDMIETIVKNIDLDRADINIRATNPNGWSAALILRYLLNYFMRRNYFGEILNTALRQFCIDGTVILKVLKNYDRSIDNQAVKTRIVDVTNFLIDPSEDNIQSAGAVHERNVLKYSECKSYPWDNMDYLKGDKDVMKFPEVERFTKTQVPYTEITERYGDLPLWCFTKRRADMDKWIPALSIISNLDRKPIIHKIVRNTRGIKPYEECRFRKVFGRWHGRGPGEILMGLQSYLSETVNLRLNQSRIAQTGLFKVRKNSGITQHHLAGLVAGGIIPVTRMDDIAELRTSDIKPSSYRDQDSTYMWAQRVTGAFEIGRGEQLPAAQPATTAVLQERGMRSGFDLLQENLGMFLSRVFERHIIPLLLETIKDKEIVSIIGSAKDLKQIDENVINQEINKNIVDHYIKKGCYPAPDYIEHLRSTYRDIFKRWGKNRYFDTVKKTLSNWKYEVEVFVTGESFNKAVMVRQLNDLILAYSRIPGINIDVDAVFKEILDQMGLSGARFITSPEERTAVPPAAREVPTPVTPRPLEETERVGEAATLETTGHGGVR